MRVAISPARGGSVRIPRKNIREFRGKPMIQWPLEAASASGLFDYIVVSTDDVEIKALALSLGYVVHIRPLDDGTTGTQEVAARVLAWLHAAPSDEVCVIYPCSPLLSASMLQTGWATWRGARTPYLLSVMDGPGPSGWVDAGCMYWGHAAAFMDRLPLEDNFEGAHWPGRLIDVNTPEDWARAESMFDALHA